VFTNGCFDILHRGHITYLNRAKALGDVLVVAVNTDESVQRLKGPTRPINNLEDRLQVLAGLSSVDYLIAFDDPTPARLLGIIQPDVFVKGGDYTRETLPEAAVVEAYGGSVQILPYIENRSTTSMIARIQETYTFPIELTPAQRDSTAAVDR
jgi:D-beta-D-heptose 7-phosphate kinase/D-beta-D-heptose 1-phosphate adenosyltransferase